MQWDLAQLDAFRVAVAEGTFEAAARQLHLTPSAVSQRIKALEIAAGQVLLVRSKPVRVTDAGAVVLRLARQTQLLGDDAGRELGTAGSEGALPVASIAVNADSLATWVLPVLAPLADDMVLDLHREDQEHTSGLLRDGRVMAAVTADAAPVPGCSVTRLGVMRYRVMASPAYVARWFASGVTPAALGIAPVVTFNRKDELQLRYLRRRSRRPLGPPTHFVPSSGEFLEAVLLGMGWGMVPEMQLAAHSDATDALVDLDPDRPADVTLYWQQWRLLSPTLDRVTDAIVRGGRAQLVQPRRRRPTAT